MLQVWEGSQYRLPASGLQTSSGEKSSKVREKSRSPFSADGYSYCKNGNSVSIRQSVFEKLDENPLLTAKSLCGSLGLPYGKYRNYVARLRCEWKYYRRNERGSICSIHAWRGWAFIPPEVSVDRATAVSSGKWTQSRARNKWLLFKNSLGRLQWFQTNRVNIYCRKPVSPSGAIQLLAHGFAWTNLITDLNALKEMFNGIKLKGAHYVFPLGFRLPQPIVVDLFGPSNGIVVKLSDRSHPFGLELQVHYPDWVERNERTLEDIRGLLRNSFPERDYSKKLDYIT